jgi:predicted cupin superfamily sugar epimerase
MTQSEQYQLRLEKIIRKLELKPHPEGGYFRETYRSSGVIHPNSSGTGYNGERNFSTCIYFLLTAESFSALHRIPQDEIWHFYDGSPICLHLITPDGDYSKTAIGRDIENGEVPQFVVPGGAWFGATVINNNDFSLVGCTVAPGFDFRDFEMGIREVLVCQFPEHYKIINLLTRD